MRALSDDLRLRIHNACEQGATTSEVAEQFTVSPATVRRLKRQFRLTGSLAPRPGGRGPAPKLAGREGVLRAAVAQHPSATPAEHAAQLNLGVSRWTVARAMRRLGLTRKKSRSTQPSATGPT